MTAKYIKNIFNSICEKHDRKFKYKRCIKNSKETVIFEAYHYENSLWSNFYGLKLLSFNKDKNIATWRGNRKDINSINKYNL